MSKFDAGTMEFQLSQCHNCIFNEGEDCEVYQPKPEKYAIPTYNTKCPSKKLAKEG